MGNFLDQIAMMRNRAFGLVLGISGMSIRIGDDLFGRGLCTGQLFASPTTIVSGRIGKLTKLFALQL